MRKLLMTGVATAFAAALFAAPAGAQFQFGYDDDDDDYGVTIEIPVYEEDDNDYEEDDDDYSGGDDDHVRWCKNHYQTYDEDTNLYYYAVGKQRECNSPHD